MAVTARRLNLWNSCAVIAVGALLLARGGTPRLCAYGPDKPTAMALPKPLGDVCEPHPSHCPIDAGQTRTSVLTCPDEASKLGDKWSRPFESRKSAGLEGRGSCAQPITADSLAGRSFRARPPWHKQRPMSASAANQGADQGSLSATPHSSKSETLRVARPARRLSAIAAIWASNCEIGRPAPRRAATTAA